MYTLKNRTGIFAQPFRNKPMYIHTRWTLYDTIQNSLILKLLIGL